MRQIISLAILLFWSSGPAIAGQIYGSITERHKSVGHGVEVEIKCPNRPRPYSGMTDRYGSYEIYVPYKGSCDITVDYRGNSYSFDRSIYSYDDPVRYDFDLRKDDGKYELRRR